MSSEVVKYSNDFNNQALRNFSSEELNLLMTIFHKLRDQSINILEYSFYDLKKLINLEKNMTTREFANTIMNVNKKLLALNYTYKEDNTIIQMAIFKTFKIKLNEQVLMISLNEDFRFLLNDFNKEWTRFELEEFVRLKSSYTKEFYRRMKQFRKTGFWKCSIEEFRYLLDIPKSYRMINIDTRILKPIKKELGEKYDLKIIKKYGFPGGRGRSRVVGFEFRFSPEKKEDIVIDNEKNSDNPIPLSKPGKPEKEEETKVVPERKLRIVEAVPEKEEEKTLSEKLKEKISSNDTVIGNLGAFCEGIKSFPKFKASLEKFMKKIEKLKSENAQLEAIYNLGEENFTKEIIELVEELIGSED